MEIAKKRQHIKTNKKRLLISDANLIKPLKEQMFEFARSHFSRGFMYCGKEPGLFFTPHKCIKVGRDYEILSVLFPKTLWLE